MRIKINKLSLFGYHGVHDKEKDNGQNFILNITAEIKGYNKEDKLDRYTDYKLIMDKTVAAFNKKRYNLLETLIDNISKEILSDQNIRYVEISIQKPNAPIKYNFESVEVKAKFKND